MNRDCTGKKRFHKKESLFLTADWGELMRMNLIDEREDENYNNIMS